MKRTNPPRARRNTDQVLQVALVNMLRRSAANDPWVLARARAARAKDGAR